MKTKKRVRTQSDSQMYHSLARNPHLFLAHIQRGAIWIGYVVGFVELAETDLLFLQPQDDLHNCSQQFAVLAGEDPGRRKFIVAVDGHILEGSLVTDFPDEVVGGSEAEPRLQDVSHAVAFVLPFKEPSRVLQPKPEPHETFLGVFDFHFD